MMNELILLFSYFLTLISLALCVYFWRRSARFQKLLLQNSDHYMSLREKHQKLITENSQNLESLHRYMDSLKAIEKEIKLKNLEITSWTPGKP